MKELLIIYYDHCDKGGMAAQQLQLWDDKNIGQVLKREKRQKQTSMMITALLIIIFLKMQSAQGRVVYFRRKSKAAYALSFKKPVTLRSLQSLLSRREGIQLENVVLIHRGRVLDSGLSLQSNTPIDHKSIVHVIDLADVKRDIIKVHFRWPDNSRKTFQVVGEMKIEEFVRKHVARVDRLPQLYIGLVYVGKLMSQEKTFFEEFVEDDCEIIVVNVMDCASGKRAEEKGRKDIGKAQDIDVNRDNEKSFNSNAGGGNPEDNETSLKNQAHPLPKIAPHLQTPQVNTELQYASSQKEAQPIEPQKVRSIDNQFEKESIIPLTCEDLPPFNIQISKVDSIDSDQGDHNHVKYNKSEASFMEDSDSSNNKLQSSSPGIKHEPLSQSALTLANFIFPGASHESQTKGFIQKLMTKYKITLQ